MQHITATDISFLTKPVLRTSRLQLSYVSPSALRIWTSIDHVTARLTINEKADLSGELVSRHLVLRQYLLNIFRVLRAMSIKWSLRTYLCHIKAPVGMRPLYPQPRLAIHSSHRPHSVLEFLTPLGKVSFSVVIP